MDCSSPHQTTRAMAHHPPARLVTEKHTQVKHPTPKETRGATPRSWATNQYPGEKARVATHKTHDVDVWPSRRGGVPRI